MKITLWLDMLSPPPPRLLHLQLDDGRELSPRRVADHHQHALDDDRLRHVEALVCLTTGEGHDAQQARRASRLDEDTAVDLVNGAGWHEDEATVAGLDAGGVEVGQPVPGE